MPPSLPHLPLLLVVLSLLSSHLAYSHRQVLFPVYSTQIDCEVQQVYVPSPIETYWKKNVESLALHSSSDWEKACAAVRMQMEAINSYLDYWKEREGWVTEGDLGEARASTGFNKEVFSYYRVTHKCGTAEHVMEVPIEPLMGALRHPLYHCVNSTEIVRRHQQKKLGLRINKDYMLPLFRHEYFPTSVKTREQTHKLHRSFFFDLGASLYRSGAGGASQEWFVKTYENRGLPFDRILAWEVKQLSPADIFAQYPADVFGKISYFNIPADATPDAPGNPVRLLKTLTKPGDFVVIKIDIDNGPVEFEFIEQILNDKEAADRIDELYFEHHVKGHPLYNNGWPSRKSSKTNITESYDVFSRLREMGIRAHSWV